MNKTIEPKFDAIHIIKILYTHQNLASRHIVPIIFVRSCKRANRILLIKFLGRSIYLI